jgi:hypothetical protein
MTEYSGIETLSVTNAIDHVSGVMIPERVLQDLLKLGFANIKADTSLIDDLFYKYDSETLNAIKTYYTEHEIAVRVNFPRDEFTFPLIAIVNTADLENVNSDLLGDYLTSEYSDASTVEIEKIVGHSVKSEFSIYCLAGKDSNAALWLYYVVKAILTMNTTTFNAHGMHNIILNGRDITLRQDLFPEMTYARVLALTCDNYFSVKLTEKIAHSLVIQIFTQQPFSDTKQLLDSEV